MKRLVTAALSLGSLTSLAAPLDAAVETSQGNAQQLARLWRKPTVLFYEDRDSNQLNQHVKDALFKAGRERGLTEAVDVVAVANVKAYNWFPARNFVLSAVRDIEKQVHVPVYLDFTGSLAEAPWSLPPRSSTVLVLSATGEPLWQKQGRLSAEALAEVFALLETLIAQPTAQH